MANISLFTGLNIHPRWLFGIFEPSTVLFLDVHILLWMCYQKGCGLYHPTSGSTNLVSWLRRHSRWGYNSRGVQVRALNVFGWLLILFVSRTFGFKRTVSESFFGHETCNFNMYFTYMYNQYINIYSNHVQVHIWSISHLQTPRIWSPAVWRWWKWPTWILQTFQSWIV